VAGVIGRCTYAYDLWGDAVNVASRMESHGLPGSIQVSAETYALIRDEFPCRSRGRIDIKGLGPMDTYLLGAGDRSHRSWHRPHRSGRRSLRSWRRLIARAAPRAHADHQRTSAQLISPHRAQAFYAGVEDVRTQSTMAIDSPSTASVADSG
jgi:hypothetical protein